MRTDKGDFGAMREERRCVASVHYGLPNFGAMSVASPTVFFDPDLQRAVILSSLMELGVVFASVRAFIMS